MMLYSYSMGMKFLALNKNLEVFSLHEWENMVIQKTQLQ